MLSKCVVCDHLFIDDEVEYLHKGKSYFDPESDNVRRESKLSVPH
jgi:hypothetical protein